MGTAINTVVFVILSLAMWLIILRAVIGWLIAFDVINLRNRFAYEVNRFLEAITDPILLPLQRIVPRFGRVDVSGIVAILIIIFIRVLYSVSVAPVLKGMLG